MYQNYHWIDDYLAVGGRIAESAELPFDAILSLETSAPRAVRDLVIAGSAVYRWLPLADNCFHPPAEVLRAFDAAADQIHAWRERNWRVLVHCTNGISRSVTAVIWYLIRYHGDDWAEALALVRARRPSAYPDIRLEIPLRRSVDPTLDRDWLDRRLFAYCQDQQRLTGILLDWRDLRREFAAQLA